MFAPDSPPAQPTPEPAPEPAPDPAPKTARETPTEPGPDDDSLALVHLGSRRWVLEPGQAISFGRGSPCDIRLAFDPVDEHVSRRAGVLEHVGEDLVVRNESTKRQLIFKPARGPERVLRPGEAITCHPHREFLVAIDGRGGNHYVIQVSALN